MAIVDRRVVLCSVPGWSALARGPTAVPLLLGMLDRHGPPLSLWFSVTTSRLVDRFLSPRYRLSQHADGPCAGQIGDIEDEQEGARPDLPRILAPALSAAQVRWSPVPDAVLPSPTRH